MPNEIVMEVMIEGLRPGLIAQYFARKPPRTLEKLLKKMDEYIQADNDSRQRREEAYMYSKMTRGFAGRLHPRHVRTIHNPKQMMTGQITPRAANKAHNLRECNKLPTGHQPQEAEGGEVLEEGLVLNPGDCSAYSVGRIRDTRQGRAKSRSKSRRSPKPKRSKISRSRSCTPLHAIRHISLNMWAISNPRHRLLRQVILKLLGLNYHHHHWHLRWPIISSQKGIARRSNNAILGRNLKLARLIALCPSQGTSTKSSATL
jgi:hypothetical protein